MSLLKNILFVFLEYSSISYVNYLLLRPDSKRKYITLQFSIIVVCCCLYFFGGPISSVVYGGLLLIGTFILIKNGFFALISGAMSLGLYIFS